MSREGTRRVTTLAIETSGPEGSLAVLVGDTVHERKLERARAHAADLFPLLAELLGESVGDEPRRALQNLERVLVGTGPGSFTGLRIGAAAARGLVRATGAELEGLPSFDAIAQRAIAEGSCGVIASDARAGRLYVARYRKQDGRLQTVVAPTAIPARSLGEFLEPGEPLFADERVAKAAGPSSLPCPCSPPPTARASDLIELVRAGRATGAALPLYLFEFGAP